MRWDKGTLEGWNLTCRINYEETLLFKRNPIVHGLLGCDDKPEEGIQDQQPEKPNIGQKYQWHFHSHKNGARIPKMNFLTQKMGKEQASQF